MRWTSQAAACLLAIVLAGCSGRDRSHDAGTTTGSGAGTETGALSDTGSQSAQPGLASDTSSGATADTATKGTSADTATQPVPSTADSLNPAVDSAR
jgi:hypothetical protein